MGVRDVWGKRRLGGEVGKRRLSGGWVINAQVMSKYAAIPNTALY